MKLPRLTLVSALCLAIVVAAIVGGCGGTSGGTVTVTIKDLRFNPQTVRVKAGESVRWLNEDTTAHTSTSADFSADATSQPAGAWSSKVMSPGDSWSRKFDQQGRFPYSCSIHPYIKGTVVVE